MKLIFVGSSLGIIYYMRAHNVVKQTYDRSEDTFRVVFLVVPCAVLALAINQQHDSPVEVRPVPKTCVCTEVGRVSSAWCWRSVWSFCSFCAL